MNTLPTAKKALADLLKTHGVAMTDAELAGVFKAHIVPNLERLTKTVIPLIGEGPDKQEAAVLREIEEILYEAGVLRREDGGRKLEANPGKPAAPEPRLKTFEIVSTGTVDDSFTVDATDEADAAHTALHVLGWAVNTPED